MQCFLVMVAVCAMFHSDGGCMCQCFSDGGCMCHVLVMVAVCAMF